MKPILSIVGAGGHGRVIADAATESGDWQHIEFFDDKFTGTRQNGIWSVVGQLKNLLALGPYGNRQVVIGIGDNALRHSLQNQFQESGWSIATIIHPSAIISRSSTIQLGVVVMAGAIVNTGAHIGAGSIINTKTSIDHDCQIGLSSHISPGSTISGSVAIGDRTWIGAGSVIINNIRIGDDAIVGAGSTVLRDIPDSVVAVGTPARIIKKRLLNQEYLTPDTLLELPR